MIRFENVTKMYPKQDRAALDSVNIDILKGEFVFLVKKTRTEQQPTSSNRVVRY